jgi:hypothetical protein
MKTSTKIVVIATGFVLAIMVGCNLIEDEQKSKHNQHSGSGQALGPNGSFDGGTVPLSSEEVTEQLDTDYKNPAEIKNYQFYLDQASNIVASLFYRELSPKQMVEHFRDTGIEPFFMNPSEPIRGVYYSTLRTKKSWPGAYNFEANFSGASTSEMTLDDITFHYNSRSGNSFAEAETSLEQAFGGLGEPYDESDVNRAWMLPDGYYLNIRYLSDLELRRGDIYNTYTEADRGSVIITVFRNTGHEH